MTHDPDDVLDPDVIAGLIQLGVESGNQTFITQLVEQKLNGWFRVAQGPG